MRIRILAIALTLAGCSTQPVDAPSLGVRDAESIDPRIPILPEGSQGPVSPDVANELNALLASARDGDRIFMEKVPEIRTKAGAAGPSQSESWIAAQVAISRLERLRAPIAVSSAQIDQLLGRKIKDGTLTSGDLEALTNAAAEMRGTTDRQLSILSELKYLMDH